MLRSDIKEVKRGETGFDISLEGHGAIKAGKVISSSEYLDLFDMRIETREETKHTATIVYTTDEIIKNSLGVWTVSIPPVQELSHALEGGAISYFLGPDREAIDKAVEASGRKFEEDGVRFSSMSRNVLMEVEADGVLWVNEPCPGSIGGVDLAVEKAEVC